VDTKKRNLKGSPSRDAFKHWHKRLPGYFYACDLDFVLVSKEPPGIIAVLDYKQPGDKVTFAEVLAYNALLQQDIPLFIVSGREELGFERLKIYRYNGGNWKPEPPDIDKELIMETHTRQEFADWEAELRANYKAQSRF